MVLMNRDAYIPKGITHDSKLAFIRNLQPGVTVNGLFMKIVIDFDHLYDDFLLDLKNGTLVHIDQVINDVRTL